MALIFLTGSALGATASSFGMLLAGRLIKQSPAGAMIPLIQNVVLILYPVEKRGTVMGLVGLVVAFGPALGPTLGGWIIDNLGLDWLSGVVIPLAVAMLIAGLFWVKPVTSTEKVGVDWLSIAESSLGFGTLLLGFSTISNTASLTWSSALM